MRQPIINDLHVASLYSDTVLAERRLRVLPGLQAELGRAQHDLHSARRDANTAWDLLSALPEYLHERSLYADQKDAVTELQTRLRKAKAERDAAIAAESRAAVSNAAFKQKLASMNLSERSVAARLASLIDRADSNATRAEAARVRVAELGVKNRDLQIVLNATAANLAQSKVLCELAESRVAECEEQMVALELEG
jgi:chromosome segregation ATPase